MSASAILFSASFSALEYSNLSSMTSAPTVTPAVVANAVYLYPNPRVALKIGTGGSGQSGLLQALAEEFIKL